MRGYGYIQDAVSVIVVVYNRLDLTMKCLRSIQNHSERVNEVIVVDNDSTDGTAQWLLGYRQDAAFPVQIASLTENVGYGRGANIGANLAEGEYLMFLNNDTEVHEGWLPTQLAEMEPDVAAVAGRLIDPDGTLQHAGIGLYVIDGVLTAQNLLEDGPARDLDCIAGTASLMRAVAYHEVGGHDPAFYCGYEDVDLCLRYRRNGWRLRYTPNSTVMHHKHASGPNRWAHVGDNITHLQERWYHPTAVPSPA